MSYYRTEEHRRLRAELIRKWKPWEKSTGPKSKEGKAQVSRNAWKGGHRAVARMLAKLLKGQREELGELFESLKGRGKAVSETETNK